MSEESKDIKSIFIEALEKKTAKERADFLDHVCGNDVNLRAEFESLLKEHVIAGDFLESPAIEPGATLDNTHLIKVPGTKIGRYELLSLIGEGGMGLVYLAEQKEPVKRRVALKIIKPGMDSRRVIARFEAERQTLALLDHPNIAHVFDAGTTETGRPYFVMEYVKGMSITRYCDEHRLDVEQRLRLFREVCEGVHHAHQKGIIHRDIKPSNILVSMHGDRAVPKIIDFGIAKAAASSLTEKTLFTFQGQLLGTPEYMSPEQVDFATQDIDTRSDIYSLGVVLYELLAGVLPFERESLEKIGFSELQRTLREQEPASPSVRLSNLGDKAKAIADSRMTQVVPLARRLHRELEWIPLKAMRKDRCRRYKSASDMADDIQSYLNGNPLLAGPETAMYRVQKFVHKHAGSVATAALVSVAVILGLVVSVIFGCRAEQARQQEEAARIQVEQALARAEKAEKEAQQQRELAEERAEAYRRAIYSNNLALAKEAIHEASIARAKKLLVSCEPELRGWEWQRLNHIADQSIMTIHGHSRGINSVAVSPDGRRFASASDDYMVKVWDATTGSEVMILRHDKPVDSVTFSPDGRHIASGGKDKTVKVWNATTGSELMTLAHDDEVQAIAFSRDGKRIASGDEGSIIKVWDATSGAEVMTLRGHTEEIRDITFSPDDKLIISSSRDDTIKIWDAATGTEIKTLRGHDMGVFSVAFSPDGKRIVSGSSDTTIKVWDVTTGDATMTLSGHADIVRSVMFGSDGKRIISAGHDRTIKMWDAITGVEIMTLRGHSGAVRSVKLNLNGTRVISAGLDGTIKTWDPAVDRDVLRLHGAGSGDNQVAFSPEGKYVAASVGNNMIRRGAIKLWDAVSGAEIITIRGHHGNIRSIAFSPDGSRIATGSQDMSIKVWKAITGALEITLDGRPDRFWAVCFSPDGKHIVSGGENETVEVWNVETGIIEVAMNGHKGTIYEVTFSPDGRRIVSAGYDGTVRVWDASSGTELLTLRGHEGCVYDISVSPDGKRIASASDDKTIRLWDVITGDELMILRGHESSVHTVFFSPDNSRIVSADHNREIKIWDAETGTELMNLYGDSSYIMSAAFSPDGRSICVGGYDGITLLESVVPAAGYEPRHIANSARMLVVELYKENTFYDNVSSEKKDDYPMMLVGDLYKENTIYDKIISKIKDDNTIEGPLRKMALQIANGRLWVVEDNLLFLIWTVVFSPDHDEVAYREALKKIEKEVSLEPYKPFFLLALGAVQYRLGDYEDALTTLARTKKKIRDHRGIQPGPVLDVFMAMVLHQLGRNKEANAAIQQLRDNFTERWFSVDNMSAPVCLRLVIEVEKLFAGEDSTLLSIWKLIEEDKLDEASKLIEKTRLSNDTDYASRMEGAVKLLEELRKQK